MTTSRTIAQLCAAALICVSLPGAAHAADNIFQSSTCRKPDYPTESLRQGEEGISLLGFLVRADGTVAAGTIFASSGSTRLDHTAMVALSKCIFTPLRKDGVPVEAWVEISYMWYFDDDRAKQRQQRNAASAAENGDAAGFFRLYLLLSNSAKTDADRERAVLMLLNAAERGHAHAQFETGLRYEAGAGVEASLEKAQQWYEKSAAQGNLLARQRLERGILPH